MSFDELLICRTSLKTVKPRNTQYIYIYYKDNTTRRIAG